MRWRYDDRAGCGRLLRHHRTHRPITHTIKRKEIIVERKDSLSERHTTKRQINATNGTCFAAFWGLCTVHTVTSRIWFFVCII